ncbi:uncharacterized protein [Watersipora subatra]|uniref:uncharacterized protein n=1 Tax=Watersipora subatra TaxID=2589382 RepID=UPI00355B8375
MLRINSIDSLIECVELYKTTNTDEESKQVSDFFDGFLSEVTHLARVNKFFHATIYHSLYQFFYEPTRDNSDEEYEHDDTSDENDEENKSDGGMNRSQPLEDKRMIEVDKTQENPPKEMKINIAKTVKRKKKKRRKPKQNLLNNIKNKRKRVDNRMKVLEQIQREKAGREAQQSDAHKLEEKGSGRDFEKLRNKTDQQRLAFAVKGIFNIKVSWDELITMGPIDTNCFEEESWRQLRDYKSYLPFEPVFRLLPDILVKGFKLIELAKIWYNSARRLGGSQSSDCHSIQQFFAQIDKCDQDITAMAATIERNKELRVIKQTERKLLVNQILRFDEVKEKYEICLEREQELKEYYKQLKGERNAEYPKLDTLARDDLQYKETYEQIQYLAESMKGVYRELQTASYELELVKQDYAVGMDNRTDLIRRQNDVKSSLKDINDSIVADKEMMTRNRYLCDKLRSKVARAWVALYKPNANQLLAEQADIHLQNKYSTHASINIFSKATQSDSAGHVSSSGEAEQLEETLDNTLTAELEQTKQLESEDSEESELEQMKETPPPPIAPAQQKATPTKEKTVLLADYNPSTAGILDTHEAKQYRERVDRLKKKFDGDEADMDSDQEMHVSRPQSKKYVKRNTDRYSPLSDVSDEYIYQQKIKPVPGPPKTIYILKRSTPKDPFKNQFVLKTVTDAKISTQKTIYRQQKAVKTKRAHEHLQGNDYESLQALDSNYQNTLSVYKNSPLRVKPSNHIPILPLEHHEGIFTPHPNLSDGDISIDSGTGDSLDSNDDEDFKGKHVTYLKSSDGYKHKPRLTVREKLAAAKISPNLTINKPSKLPRLQKTKLEPSKNNLLSVVSPSISKSSPESLESRPIVFKSPVNKPAARNTLHMKKRFQPPAQKQLPKLQPKPSNEPHPLAPTKRVAVGKLVERKLPMGKVPKSNHQPKLVPRKQHARVLESPSDDSIDEIFKQSTVSHRTLPPKPSVRVGLQPQRMKRKYGIQHSLGKVK